MQQWLADRYPVFKSNFSTSAAVLAKLIKIVQDRGYKPVLFELPRNNAVIGSSLNAPTTKYREKCKKLAAANTAYRGSASSPQPGCPTPTSTTSGTSWSRAATVWQKLLSAKTADLLEQYGYDGGS